MPPKRMPASRKEATPQVATPQVAAPEPRIGSEIEISFDLNKGQTDKKMLVHVNNVEYHDGFRKNYHLSGVDERIDISREQVAEAIVGGVGRGAWALIKIEIPKDIFQNTKLSDTIKTKSSFNKEEEKYIFNISSYPNEDSEDVWCSLPGDVLDDLRVLLFSKRIKFTFEYVYLSGYKLRRDDQEGVSRDSVTGYICSYGCGFGGSFTEVANHENFCSLAPEPVPVPTPEPEDNGGLLSNILNYLSKSDAAVIMDNLTEATGVSRNSIPGEVGGESTTGVSLTSTARLMGTSDSHKITKKRKKKTKKKKKTKGKKRKKKTKRYVKRNIK
jgi:hypothetical protein